MSSAFKTDAEPVLESLVRQQKEQEEKDENIESANRQSTKDRTFTFYQKLRRSNPSRYYTPAVQAQLLKDAQIRGKDFYKNEDAELDVFKDWKS